MKNIGILTCLRAGQVCAGVSCLRAFAERRYFFEKYGADVRLLAFMKCNGCPKGGAAEPRQDPGILEKVERLSQEGIEAVHVGVCRFQKTENGERKECERLMEICQMIEEKGIPVIRGTHRE